MKTLRLFTLLEQLRGRTQPVAAETLADALGVSVRTIYRDMVTLQAAGAPVRGESGVGYLLENDYFLPPLNFDADEREAMMLGMRMMAARGDPALAAAARRVMAKVSSAVGNEKSERFKRLPLRAATRTGAEHQQTMVHLPALRQAIRGGQQLRIEYRDLQGQASQRIARPLGLTLFDAVWLLTVWCELRGDFRNLRVDKLVSVTPTGLRFRPEPGRRFEDYLRLLPELPAGTQPDPVP